MTNQGNKKLYFGSAETIHMEVIEEDIEIVNYRSVWSDFLFKTNNYKIVSELIDFSKSDTYIKGENKFSKEYIDYEEYINEIYNDFSEKSDFRFKKYIQFMSELPSDQFISCVEVKDDINCIKTDEVDFVISAYKSEREYREIEIRIYSSDLYKLGTISQVPFDYGDHLLLNIYIDCELFNEILNSLDSNIKNFEFHISILLYRIDNYINMKDSEIKYILPRLIKRSLLRLNRFSFY